MQQRRECNKKKPYREFIREDNAKPGFCTHESLTIYSLMNEKEQDIALSFSTDTNLNAYYSSPT
jgi:hypothetical protein